MRSPLVGVHELVSCEMLPQGSGQSWSVPSARTHALTQGSSLRPRRSRPAGLVIFLLALLVAFRAGGVGDFTGALPNQPAPALFIFSSSAASEMDSAIEIVRENGGTIAHVFPPHVAIGTMARSAAESLVGKSWIEAIYFTPVDSRKVAKYGQDAIFGVEAWNNNYMGYAQLRGLEHRPSDPEPPPIQGDLRVPPPRPMNASMATGRNLMSFAGDQRSLAAAPPYGAGRYDTSEYMLGDVSIGIILPESTGAIDPQTETWTSTEQSNLVSEIQAAMNWWSLREPNARLTFRYHQHLSVPTGYEPINHPQSDEGLWISQVMGSLGYSDIDYFERVYSYLNAIRNADGTDWAVAIFVVDSSNDADGLFTDGYFAYAYLGGPFIVMTYKNDGYTIANMDAVTAHELGHSFWALDEYSSAPTSCTETTGYLNVQNQNYDGTPPCLLDVSSIMRGQVTPYTNGAVDPYARQQIGWRDSDFDGVMDILDFEPNSSLNVYTPDPTSDNTPYYTGSATSTATLPNANPKPWNSGNDITTNTIAKIEFRVNSGPWMTGWASDGSFDAVSEGFAFTPFPLSPGAYTFESRAQNSAGIWETTYSSDTLTILAFTGYVGMLNFDDYRNRMGSLTPTPSSTTLYFPHYHQDASWETYIAIAWPSAPVGAVNTITLTAYSSTGTIVAANTLTLTSPNQKLSGFVDQLIPGAVGTGWIEVEATFPIVGLLNFDDYRNRMGSMSGVVPNATLVFPHAHQDAYWETFLSVVNPDPSQTASITIHGYLDFGTVSQVYSLGPRTKLSGFVTTLLGISGTPVIGWLKIVSSIPVVGMLNFDDYANRMGSVENAKAYRTIFFSHFHQDASWETFISIVNPLDTLTALVQFTAYRADGSVANTQSLVLAPNGKASGFVSSLIGVTGTGWIKVESNSSIAGLLNFDDYAPRMGSQVASIPLDYIAFAHYHQDTNWETFYAIVSLQPATITAIHYNPTGIMVAAPSNAVVVNQKIGAFSAFGIGWLLLC